MHRGESLVTRYNEGLTGIVVHVVSGLVPGNDVFARSSVAQLTVLSAAEGKYCDGRQGLRKCV